jgi:hypothetical protein
MIAPDPSLGAINFFDRSIFRNRQDLEATRVKSAKPSSGAAACDTSIILPPTKGPRSVILTAERPFS